MKVLPLKSAIVLFVILCAGCGSLRTLPPGSEYRLSHNKRYEGTNCNSIPRIYSGVSLDACMAFIGPPTMPYERYNEGVFFGCLVDMALSFTVDTLALPYTVPTQMKSGNLYLKRKFQY